MATDDDRWEYPSFESYIDELQGIGTRLEWFLDDLDHASNTRMIEWLRAAFEAGRSRS